jgi:poly(3-hydroxyalkanoate) depolymerase
MDIRHVTIEGQHFRVGIRRGASHLPPLLILNGIGASLELIAPFVSAFPDLEVITFDVPGTGGSRAPLLPYRLPGFARLVHKLLDELGYNEPVDALGISWGGTLAQTFAFQFPKHCRKLVLASTSPGVLMVPGRLGVLTKLLSPRRYADPQFLHKFGGEIYGGAYRHNPELIRNHNRAIQAPSHRGYLYQLMAVSGWTSLPWLRLLKQPTLIMHGIDDPIVPLINAKILSILIRRAELQVIDDGHLFVISKAKEAAAIVAHFLAKDP